MNFTTAPTGKGRTSCSYSACRTPACRPSAVPPAAPTTPPHWGAEADMPHGAAGGCATFSNGSDLDTGFCGTSHNFPVFGGGQLKYCLSDCDGTTDPDASAPATPGAVRSTAPPSARPCRSSPSGLPVCVVNGYQPGPSPAPSTSPPARRLPARTRSTSSPKRILRRGNPEVCPRCIVSGKTDADRDRRRPAPARSPRPRRARPAR